MVAPLGTRPGSEQFSYYANADGWCRCRIIRRPVRSNRGPPHFGHLPVHATEAGCVLLWGRSLPSSCALFSFDWATMISFRLKTAGGFISTNITATISPLARSARLRAITRGLSPSRLRSKRTARCCVATSNAVATSFTAGMTRTTSACGRTSSSSLRRRMTVHKRIEKERHPPCWNASRELARPSEEPDGCQLGGAPC
jgi:hypothetical protein